jgi:hypothetical protein
MDQLKRAFFQHDPDEPVIFHRKELVNRRSPFHSLRDSETEQRFNTELPSRELKVKPKSANIAGLQLADLIAHPSRREVLIEHRLIVDDRHIFGDQICHTTPE